jgi:hypothetical protein
MRRYALASGVPPWSLGYRLPRGSLVRRLGLSNLKGRHPSR